MQIQVAEVYHICVPGATTTLVGKIHRNFHRISPQKIGIWSIWSSIGILHRVLISSIEVLKNSIKLHGKLLWSSIETLWNSICQFSLKKSYGDLYEIFLKGIV
jgi:hypothetical protein